MSAKGHGVESIPRIGTIRGLLTLKLSKTCELAQRPHVYK